jgi:predicted AlkP superfamily pyrophosphatase or phosphodiesterase
VIGALLGLIYSLHAVPGKPKLILISIDGFRADYFDLYKNASTFLRSLAEQGVKAEYLQPVFPTKTFPNHYTIVTGLYPESHGIVENTFYDPIFNATYRIDSVEVTNGRWYGGEPIWVTIQKNNFKSGILSWPGSEASINGVRPTWYQKYNYSEPYDSRVQKAIDLMSSHKPDLITLYFDKVDSQGHNKGPDSVEQTIYDVDRAIETLVDGIAKLGVEANYIILSDHGMAGIDTENTIYLNDCINLDSVDIITVSPNAGIDPHNNNSGEVYQNLSTCHPNLKVYYKEALPLKFHYSNSIRIPPILALADIGWIIARSRSNTTTNSTIGVHGYDNGAVDMRAIFIACGKAFMKNVTVPGFTNLNIYPLMAKILGVEPAPNNGSIPEGILSSPNTNQT